MRLLIIKLGALGDVVRTSYFLPGLRKKAQPAPRITWVTSKSAIPLLKHHPDIDELFSWDEITSKAVPWGNQKFDWVISLDDEYKACGLLQGLTWTKLTGAYLRDNQVDYSEDAAPWFEMGLISKLGKQKADALKRVNQRTHDQIFGDILGIEVGQPEFFNGPPALAAAQRLLDGKTGHYIGLNLSAGNRWLNKQLGKVEAALLVEKLSRAGFPLLLLGGVEDMAYNDSLSRNTGCPLLPPAPLDEFAAVIGQLKAIITADTLALHLAVAQRIPSVSFYAPTSAAEINTFGRGLKVISTAADYCNYQSSADNSTITAERIFETFSKLPR